MTPKVGDILKNKDGSEAMVCTCGEPKDCILHSCPCGCDMSIADDLYRYYHSDLRDIMTLDDYISAEEAEAKALKIKEILSTD